MGDCGGCNAATVGKQSIDNFSRFEEGGEQLLPGIPNEITIDHICTKLPWQEFFILSSVSRFWLEAVRSHRVHGARVRSSSAETLIVHCHDDSNGTASIALYSMKERFCFELPPIPRFSRGIPWSSQCISLDGKIYVLGGGPDDGIYDLSDGKEVHVLDLVGQRQWRQCARMQTGRYKFGSGAINGKIYVFGGAVENSPVRGCEVYDPKLNSWSPAMPMPSLRFGHGILTMGQELLVHGGEHYHPGYAAWQGKRSRNNRRLRVFIHHALFLEAYHPVKDEWRVVEPFLGDCSRCVFVAGGKFHLMTQAGISVFDTDSNSWKELHSNSFAAISGKWETYEPRAAVAVNDVLLVKAYHCLGRNRRRCGVVILEGKGFGGENEVITWQLASNCPHSSEDFMYSIQL